MDSWWSSMSNFEHVYWIIAVAASTVLVVQLILSFVSGFEFHAGSDLGVHHGVDGIGEPHFQLLTIRTVVAFFALMGWTGLACYHQHLPKIVTISISFLCGLVMMATTAGLFLLLAKLQCSGNTDYSLAVGQLGKVYLPIPPNKQGTGKIEVIINGRKVEMDAITTCDIVIASSREIRVKEVNNNIALVERV